MKLITLNIWGGYVKEPLLEFIHSNRLVDIFCLQEVYNNACMKMSTDDKEVSLNIFSELQALLPNHRAIFTSVTEDAYGIAMFVKKEIEIVGSGEVSVFENPNYPGRGPTHSRKLQWVKCCFNGQNYFTLNLHGLWNGLGKADSPARIAQSQKIRDFLDTIQDPKILCGDFNLRPDTESMKILEKGMHNLIPLYNIDSTRTSLYTKDEKYADYILVSPEVKLKDFKKLRDEVSDHSPLFLEFELSSTLAELVSV